MSGHPRTCAETIGWTIKDLVELLTTVAGAEQAGGELFGGCNCSRPGAVRQMTAQSAASTARP